MRKTRLTNGNSPDEVRPIGARALKSAIDTLRPYLLEASVLDLFAGQGRFGITASDEGIREVTFVEKSQRTATDLKSFCVSKQFPKGVKPSVLCQDAFHFLRTTSNQFDIVFADPPFPLWIESFESMLFSSVLRVLKPESIFLVKCPSRMVISTELERLKTIKTSNFGESKLVYFEYESK